MKVFKSHYKESDGEIESRLREEYELYQQKRKEASTNGKLLPLGERSLIFDEVKVAAKLQWNSSDNSIVGYAMTRDEMASLQDIFQEIDKDTPTPKTDYILQTMWRDHTSSCDIVGPYYTSSGTMTANFTLTCVLDATRKFHAYGFKVLKICSSPMSALFLSKDYCLHM